MHQLPSAISRPALAFACLISMFSNAGAAPLKPSPEDRYIATRDAAIARFSPLYDAGSLDVSAQKAEAAAFTDLQAQMIAILGEPDRRGYGPAKLNIETLYKGDQGFGMLDGLRFDALIGTSGAKAGANGADGKYVEPKFHIIVTSQTLFERWLHAHKDWWDKGLKNVPQQIGAALANESFYTQAISTDAAVINFNLLPIASPASTALAHAILAGRTQSEIPDAADEVFVSALANGKVYIAYGSIEPEVKVAACVAMRVETNKKAAQADEDFRFNKIDKKAYDRLGDLRQKAEDAFKRCFTQRAPREPAFVQASKQAEALLAGAMGR